MEFTAKFFDPSAGGTVLDDGTIAFRRKARDRAGADPTALYLYPRRTVLAVNIALAAKRPLLIFGEPGSGKTTLARNAAAVLGWSYYQDTITSRTQASDLLYTFDTLGRLNDATDPEVELQARRYYIRPGTLWWAFNPQTAKWRGDDEWNEGPQPADPVIDRGTDPRAVVLLDEIDKADPDVPNDLLEPFDRRTFPVSDAGNAVIPAVRDVLLILTTNGERDLPPAFLRRCVTLKLDEPTADWYVRIAEQRYGPEQTELFRTVADEVMRLRGEARSRNLRRPGTAEFLDAVEASRDLDIRTNHDAWIELAASVLWKNERIDIPKQANEQAQA
jgi:MoxR-like ATPase